MTKQNSDRRRNSHKRRLVSDPLGPNSEIGRKLKQYYDALISDEVPDRFSQLLSELEKKEKLNTPRQAAKED
ncbi:NepR family anti-sigma factor [Chelativorans intermedius]|uniref:NepR family anti-sigma factor n=1 Tax=Chelativorans intermedius TaxID=515947 RepID=A0ABV6DAJ6_9HYPH|nr:NepR family anti-sigma factor [Chelativorans intermedius]MCT8997951.1 NepR family anti-sigma factor [Chelativorans intermedius]